MEWLGELWRRLLFPFRRRQFDRDLEEEMRFHLEMKARESGPAAARRKFGNATLLHERSREMWTWRWLERAGQDVRYGLRTMVQSPVFTVVAMASLALGIGINTSMFHVVSGLLWQSAPVARPERFVALYNTGLSSGGLDSIATADYESYRDGAGVFESLAVYSSISFSVRMGAVAESVPGELVSDNYFSTLGIQPLLGRPFSPDLAGIVISYGFWRRRFGGDPAVTSRNLTIAGTALPIVGVAPRGFRGLAMDLEEPPSLWAPLSLHHVVFPSWTDYGRGMHWWDAVGRLLPGVTQAQAQAAVFAVSARLAQDYPETNSKWRAKLLPLTEARETTLHNPLVSTVVVLSAVAGVVLLITCANLANLLLARGWKRRRELAVRVALGATRGRLMAQLLTETVLLAALGGAAGLVLSVWGSDLLGRFYRPFRGGAESGMDARMAIFALAVSILTGLLFGIGPARQASRVDLSDAMKPGLAEARRFSMRRALVAVQVALSLVLLIGAGLFVETFRNARRSDVTFAARNVLMARVDLATQRYPAERATRFWPRLLEAARQVPGVTSASLVWITPHEGMRGGTDVFVGQQRVQVDFNVVTPEYFATIGIPLVRGRDFEDRDDAGAPPRVIVNEVFARRFWPGEDPLGKTFRLTRPPSVAEVVGVVRDGKFRGFRASVRPCFYRPLDQQAAAEVAPLKLTLEVRTTGRPEALGPVLREAVARLDPDLPLNEVQTWQEHIGRSMATENMLATLLSGFGLLALLLASTGTYGVVSFAVAQRNREMGIRIALGADRATILRDVLGGVLLPVVAGIVAGVAGAAALTRLVKNMLYGVSATDVTVFAMVVAIELGVAVAAAYVPGRRATKIDPMEALRCE